MVGCNPEEIEKIRPFNDADVPRGSRCDDEFRLVKVAKARDVDCWLAADDKSDGKKTLELVTGFVIETVAPEERDVKRTVSSVLEPNTLRLFMALYDRS